MYRIYGVNYLLQDDLPLIEWLAMCRYVDASEKARQEEAQYGAR